MGKTLAESITQTVYSKEVRTCVAEGLTKAESSDWLAGWCPGALVHYAACHASGKALQLLPEPSRTVARLAIRSPANALPCRGPGPRSPRKARSRPGAGVLQVVDDVGHPSSTDFAMSSMVSLARASKEGATAMML